MVLFWEIIFLAWDWSDEYWCMFSLKLFGFVFLFLFASEVSISLSPGMKLIQREKTNPSGSEGLMYNFP